MDLIDELLVHAGEVIYHTGRRPMTFVLGPRCIQDVPFLRHAWKMCLPVSWLLSWHLS